MDYKFTFEDGSEALIHYGVLGMKWGVRHDRARTAQKMRQVNARNTQQISALRKKAARTNTTIFGRSHARKAVKLSKKADRLNKKATKAYQRGNVSKYADLAIKSDKLGRKVSKHAAKADKAAKLNRKADKLQRKTDRLNRAYSREMRRISEKEKARGRNAVQSVI